MILFQRKRVNAKNCIEFIIKISKNKHDLFDIRRTVIRAVTQIVIFETTKKICWTKAVRYAPLISTEAFISMATTNAIAIPKEAIESTAQPISNLGFHPF